MSEHGTERLIADAAPAAPDEVSLVRVRARALGWGEHARVPWLGPLWRRAAAIVAATVVLVIVAAALLPRGGGSDIPSGPEGFVAARAAEAFAPPGKVLHVVAETGDSMGVVGRPGDYSGWTRRIEQWYDAERGTVRQKNTQPGGGQQHDFVMANGRLRKLVYRGDPGGPTSDSEDWTVYEGPAVEPAPYDPEGRGFGQKLKSALASGQATVIGEEVTAGARYWRVAMDEESTVHQESTGGVATQFHTEALFRQPDYRLLWLELSWGLPSVVPTSWSRYTTRVLTWEHLSRDSVPGHVFDLDSISSTGALEQRTYETSQIALFEDFDVFWLGDSWAPLGGLTWESPPFGPGIPAEVSRVPGGLRYIASGSPGVLAFIKQIGGGDGVYAPLFFEGVHAEVSAHYGSQSPGSGSGYVYVASFPQLPRDAHVAALKARWPGWPVERGSVDGRDYLFVRGGAPHPPATALLNLGDATVYVAASSGHPLREVIAALKKAN